MKKCKLCGRHKREYEYSYSRRSADGLRCTCNECLRRIENKVQAGSMAAHRIGPMAVPAYIPPKQPDPRNNGHKEIKSRGIGC